MCSKVKDELEYEVTPSRLERYAANRLIEQLIDLLYRLKVTGDLLYNAKNEDWSLPKHFEFALETLTEADGVVSSLERDRLLLLKRREAK